MKTHFQLLTLVLFCLAAHCAGAQGKPLEFRTVLQGDGTGVEQTAIHYIRSAEEWRRLWRLHVAKWSAPPEPPAVDFTASHVIAFFAGERPSGGFRVSIQTVREDAGKITLEVDERIPGDRCLSISVLTHPFHFVSVSAMQGSMAFDFSLARQAGSKCGG